MFTRSILTPKRRQLAKNRHSTQNARSRDSECNGLLTSTEPDSLSLSMTDWRVDNAKWTRGAVLRFQKYARPRENWDHDHCEGCWAKFMETGSPEVLTEGYVTEDNRRWICPECFRDLQQEMEWKLA